MIVCSCIKLKTEYPEIKYYTLTQELKPPILTEQLKGTLQIKDFTISDENEKEYITVRLSNSKVHQNYYSRWSGDFSSLFSDFLFKRYNNSQVFSGGVVKSSSIAVPDYYLEGHIVEMFAYNSELDRSDSNIVFLSLKVNLFKRIGIKIEREPILSRTYNSKITRVSNSVSNIADSYSKCAADIADIMVRDFKLILEK